MEQIHKNFYFYTTLVSSKIKFKLNNFFQIWKKLLSFVPISFWKSFSRFSHHISSKHKIWISTLKKIRNKIFLKNLISNLFISSNWISFSELDIVNSSDRNLFFLKKKIKNSADTNDLNFSVITTNKIFNKIFWNFTSTILLPLSSNTSIFLEKYFLKEKYTRALGLTNEFKTLFIKFFLFYTTNSSFLKKIIFLKKKNFFGGFLKKINTFMQLFLNKRYFIFFKNPPKKIIFLNFLNEFFSNFFLIDALIFMEGNIFFKTEQCSAFSNTFNTLLNSSDLNFIDLFFKVNKTNFLAYNICKKILLPAHQRLLVFATIQFNSIAYANSSKFLFIKILQIFIKLKITSFSIILFIFFNKLFFFWCQLLNN